MTSEAIRLILNKAWENNSWALIFVEDKRKFEINPRLWDWKIYDSIDTLCIFLTLHYTLMIYVCQ